MTAVIQVRLFAHYRDRAGMRDCEIELDDGSTVADLVLRLRADPRLDWLPLDPLIAVNRDYADYGRNLASGDEVALIPPVSGG